MAQRQESVLSRHLKHSDLAAVAEVRGALRELLRGRSWGHREQAAVAELLTSELVTNALVHTDHDARVTATFVRDRVASAAGRLRVEVRDFVARRPVPCEPGGEGTGGRGLLLVQALADAWGVRPQGSGKVVWFELDGRPA